MMKIVRSDDNYRVRCDECNQRVDFAVELGEKPWHESATANICLPCLRKAVQLAEGEERQAAPGPRTCPRCKREHASPHVSLCLDCNGDDDATG